MPKSQTSGSGSDRRVFERFEARFPARIKDSRYDFGTVISLHNASAQGLNLFSKERFYINDSVILEIKLPDNDEPLTVKGQVLWNKACGPSLWECGIKFYEISLLKMSRLFRFSNPISHIV